LEVIKEMTFSGRQSQTPTEATLLDESMVVGLCRKKEGEGKGRENVDGVRSASGCVHVYRRGVHPVGRSGALVLEYNRHTTRGSKGTAWVSSCL
jgi:hypothetical protein